MRAALALLAGLLLAACAGPNLPPPPRPDLSRPPPHTDQHGQVLTAYVDGRSFLPVGVYHAIEGKAFGATHALARLREAGFTLVHLWPEQDIKAALDEAGRLGLAVLVQHPPDPPPDWLASHPAVIAWELEHEASQFVAPEATEARLARFAERADRLRATDPFDRPATAMENAGIAPRFTDRWRRWIAASGIALHFNYPFAEPLGPVRSLGRIARSVGRARDIAGDRPLWFVVQAFAGPPPGWNWPPPGAARAMAYTALLHGASGLIFFGADSHGMRDGQVFGFAADPPAAYEPSPDYDGDGRPPAVASGEDLAASRRLWREVSGLARELGPLAPALLRADADWPHTVVVGGGSPASHFVQTMAKPIGDDLLLVAVNLTDRDLRVEFLAARPPAAITRLEAGASAPSPGRDGWSDGFAPFEVKLYRLSGWRSET